MVEALTKALDEVGEGAVKKISLNVEYLNEGEVKNITVSLIP